MQQRPAGRQRVRGRAGRGRDDQAVRALVVHELAVHGDFELDHAGAGAARHHHVVDGQTAGDGGAIAGEALEQASV